MKNEESEKPEKSDPVENESAEAERLEGDATPKTPQADDAVERWGISRVEFRRLRKRFIEATSDEERVEIFNLLLNEKLYDEFRRVARRCKGMRPDIESISLVNRYLGKLLGWRYDNPKMLMRFEELDAFAKYSRAALQFALFEKLRRDGKTPTLPGDEIETSDTASDIDDFIDADSWDYLLATIKSELAEPLEFIVFKKRLVDANERKPSFAEIAKQLKEEGVADLTSDQVRAIFNKALEKARRVLRRYWRELNDK